MNEILLRRLGGGILYYDWYIVLNSDQYQAYISRTHP
jgi:hypothetical protein